MFESSCSFISSIRLGRAVVAFALGVFFVVESGFASEPSAVLRIGYQSSPPYQVIGEDGSVGGIAIDLVRTAAERLEIELEWVYCPKSPDHHFAAGDVDLWPIVTDLPDRRRRFHITKPIYENSLGILSREENPIGSPQETAGKRVAYYDREPSLTLVPQLMPSAIPVPMPGHVDAIESVLRGESDAAFLWSTKANSMTFKMALDQHPEVPIHFYAFPDEKLSCGVGADKNDPAAVEAADLIREEIGELVREGYVQTVYFRYYLDPENEISSFFWLDDLRRKANSLAVAIGGLLGLVALLGVMSFYFQRSRKKALAATKAKSEFLANMSHEFRTPLNGIMGMTQLAMVNPANEEQKELLDVVLKSGDALLTIVNDILDLSKMESGRLSIELEPLDLEDLLVSATSFFKIVSAQKSVAFESHISERCPRTIKSDVARLRQILFNLVGNAVKFTSSGCVRVSVDTIRLAKGEFLVFDIRDTGIGIPENLHGEIFEAFNQVDTSNTRNYGGTGVGLTICRNLVNLLGGEIHVESVVDRGSVFSVFIPLLRVELGMPAQQDLEAPAVPQVIPRELSILVVDDNSLNLQTMEAVLKRMNHKVTCVNDGKTAIDKVDSQPFDLIFMDLHMSGFDGWETTRAIRQRQAAAGAETPIVALTASVYSKELKLQVAREMDGLVFKPFEISALHNEIERLTADRN